MSPALSDSGSIDDDEMPSEKNASLIMGTNSNSIVSKRSVERLYLPKPHFYRYFVKKPQRRSPTINRGYWLRMKAIDCVVRKFLERQTDQQKVVINLGAGYDTIPFQWLTTEPELCGNTKFIDVDYEELMNSKRDIVLNTPELNDLFTVGVYEAKHNNVLFNSEQYGIIGCDLKNLKTLRRAVRSIVDIKSAIVLCVSEVALAYMATEDADAVLSWCSILSKDVTFCLLEQWCPDREDHPFMSQMLKHFAKLGTPLRSALTYTGVHCQTQRFQEAGYSSVECLSLWDMWADPRFLSPSQRMQLDQVEPFDEWEEFALFASHYAYIIAETCLEPLFPDLPPSLARRDSDVSNLSDMSARTASPYRADHEWFAFTYSPNPGLEGRTHHASAYLSPEEDAIAVTGGIGLKGRQATTSIYAAQDDANIHPALPSSEIGARCCHTVTTLQNRQNLLIGGRTSPSNPLRDCWLQTGRKWERVHDLPEPRYRHRAACIILPDNTHGVIVFGGKTSHTRVATEPLLWGPREGWRRLRYLSHDPVPRFGPSFVRLGFNHGIMFGGMRQDGIVCQGLWRWRLMVHDGSITGIKFRTSTALDTTVGIYPWLGRLGASYSVTRNELLIIGGIAKAGCIRKEYEILSIVGSFSAYADHEKEMDLRVLCVSPRIDPGVPRPLLVGHSTHRTVHETSLIVGGGCTCFSFGAYWNAGAWLMHDRVQGVHKPWILVKPPPAQPETQTSQILSNGAPTASPPVPVQVSSTRVNCDADFRLILRTSMPKIIINLDIGPCTKLWNHSYLKSKTAASRQVVVHSSPISTMNFQRKDSFNYTHLPLHTFLNILASSAKFPELEPHMYLRSISSASPKSKPAILETDWPEIACDFKLPPSLSYISQNLHSSPLRISTNLSMWLHYDVMANVLFHVSSSPKPTPKILILFPPRDIKYLSFLPGSTTSNLDILPSQPAQANKDQDSRSQHTTVQNQTPSPMPNSPPYVMNSNPSNSTTTALNLPALYLPPGTHPQIVTLPPNTALYIPPLWSHTALPSPPGVTNISVNTFFYSLSRPLYPAGRDVYGNRDLVAYEDGRRDVERVVKRFIDVIDIDSGKTNHRVKETTTISSTATTAAKIEANAVANGEVINGISEDGSGKDTPIESPSHNNSNASETPTSAAGPADPDTATNTEPQGMPKEVAKAYLERLGLEILEKAAAL